MKKYFLILCVISCLSVYVVAQGTDLLIQSPTVVSPRLDAIGGEHVSFHRGYDAMFTNSAGLARVKDGSYFGGFSMSMPAFTLSIPSLILDKGIENFSDIFATLLSENTISSVPIEVSGPIAFGLIKNGIGFGIFSRGFEYMELLSLSNISINMGGELSLLAGYGFNIINTKNNQLSLGFMVKGFTQVYFSKTSSVANIISIFSDAPIFTTGFGIDAGILYTFADILSFGVTYKDIYTPVFTTKFSDINALLNWESPDILPVEEVNSLLSAGLGVSIPVDFTGGVISSWDVYISYFDILDAFSFPNRNPILNIAAGTELILLDVLSLRAGIRDTYAALGAGIKLGAFNIDATIYGKEMGYEPGSMPLVFFSFGLTFKK